MASDKTHKRAARVFLIPLALLFALAFAGSSRAASPESSLAFGAGYRVDKLAWNIAGNTAGTNPDILSELTWKDLKIFDMRATYRRESQSGFYLKGSLGYGFIFGGKNQDSDYNGNGRTQESSRSNNKADTGSVWDTSLGAGYKGALSLKDGTLDIIPMIGYAVYQQNLRITNGFQTIPPTGPFGGLDSTYTARWFGPWAGAEAAYKSGKMTFTGGLEYHLVNYSAVANWNLRTDFKHPDSFDHSATGYGIKAAVGADYALTSEWSINGSLDALKFRATNGIDTTRFADGTSASTRLNEVKWDSLGALLGIKYRF